MALNVSAKVHYACLAMLELAKHHTQPKPVQMRKLADAHQISSQFLVQILLQLKTARLVESTRGASGGYRLARLPTEISIGDIVRAVEGPSEVREHDASLNPTAITLTKMFQALNEHVWEQLDSKSLQDLVNEVPVSGEPMYYI